MERIVNFSLGPVTVLLYQQKCIFLTLVGIYCLELLYTQGHIAGTLWHTCLKTEELFFNRFPDANKYNSILKERRMKSKKGPSSDFLFLVTDIKKEYIKHKSTLLGTAWEILTKRIGLGTSSRLRNSILPTKIHPQAPPPKSLAPKGNY